MLPCMHSLCVMNNLKMFYTCTLGVSSVILLLWQQNPMFNIADSKVDVF
jgi:hypothetical protein